MIVRNVASGLLLAAACVAGSALGASAATVHYDEAVSGDRPNAFVGPFLTLGEGINTVTGTVTFGSEADIDWDKYALRVGPGNVLNFAIYSMRQLTPDGSVGRIGWSFRGLPDPLNNLLHETELRPDCNRCQLSVLGLGEGSYFLMSDSFSRGAGEAFPATVAYDIELHVGRVVPLPATIWLAGASIAAIGLAGRVRGSRRVTAASTR